MAATLPTPDDCSCECNCSDCVTVTLNSSTVVGGTLSLAAPPGATIPEPYTSYLDTSADPPRFYGMEPVTRIPIPLIS